MMDLQQLKLGSKVKLKLIQPQFKCSGRDDVEFQTRGKVKEVSKYWFSVEFKSRGELVTVEFDDEGTCLTDSFRDLKII